MIRRSDRLRKGRLSSDLIIEPIMMRRVVNQYIEYVRHTYTDAVVVFDGYDSTYTKDMTQQRRSKSNSGTSVTFTSDTGHYEEGPLSG